MSLPIIHCHIPKAGGTSLLVLFRTWYGNKVVRKNDYPRPTDYKMKVLSGHFPYNDEYWDFRWLTFVRHPVSRLESFWRYKQMKLKNRPRADDFWSKIIRHQTVEQWLEHPASKNLMTKQLAGKRPQENLETGDLKKAIKAISGFWFVGLQEQYSSDIEILAGMLGETVEKLPHHLKTSDQTHKTYSNLYGNEADFEVYNYVKKEIRNIT